MEIVVLSPRNRQSLNFRRCCSYELREFLGLFQDLGSWSFGSSADDALYFSTAMRAEDALTKLVESIGIPFPATPMGKELLPNTHHLAATAARSLAIGKCDVALVVGARLNWLLQFGEPPKWSRDVKFILVRCL